MECPLPSVELFLAEKLKLVLHPEKVCLLRYSKGIDFLGNVIFPHHQVLRTKTKRRVLSKLKAIKKQAQVGIVSTDYFYHAKASYLGLLKHCRGEKISREIINLTMPA